MRAQSVLLGCLFLLGLCLALPGRATHAKAPAYDVVVVGGTPAGVMAAVATARHGERVLLLERTDHLGGVVSQGLTASDVGRFSTVGGLSREIFRRVLSYYRQTYGPGSPQARDCHSGTRFEPHVAERIFRQMVAAEPGISVRLRTRLAAVDRSGDRIASLWVDDLATARRRRVTGGVYIDATYEGDLMEGAGIEYRVGREGMNEYGEPHGLGSPERPGDAENGDGLIQAYNLRLCLTRDPRERVSVPRPDGYDPGEYRLLRQRIAERGSRMHFSPDVFSAVSLPNDKADANAGRGGGQTSDFVGANYGYPDGDWTRRAAIYEAHRRYVQGLLYFVQNDACVPARLRAEAREWGLARDEFADNGHWPEQLYIREARRMVGSYVFREQDVTADRYKADSIGVGSYPIDMHLVERQTSSIGRVWMGGGLAIRGVKPYEIPYGVLVPRDVTNLLVPVCLSATNIGFASLRMEPVYMILGHAAGDAAFLANAARIPVQDVDVPELQRLLSNERQIFRAPRPPVAGFTLHPPSLVVRAGEPVRFQDASFSDRRIVTRLWSFDDSGRIDSTAANPVWRFPLRKLYHVSLRVKDCDGDWSDPASRDLLVLGAMPSYPDLTLDNDDAHFAGKWPSSDTMDGFWGEDYRFATPHDGTDGSARYVFALPAPGRYDVAVSDAPDTNRATNTLVVIRHRGRETRLRVNQRKPGQTQTFRYLGTYAFGSDAVVEIRTDGADGTVVADAVRLVYVGPP